MLGSFFKKRKRVTFEDDEDEARAAGIDLLVSPVQRLQQEDEGRLKLKDGELTVVAKKKKCKDFDEWERGFLRILCEAPAEARDDLANFMAWSKTIAAKFSFFHFNEFYEHLVRQVQRSTAGISLDEYDKVWRVYKQQHGLQEKGMKTKPPRGWYSWRRDAEEQSKPTAPEDAGGGKGKGKGAGGRGRGRHGGGRGRGVAVPLGEPRSSSGAPAGAEGVPVVAPDPMVEADAALELEEPMAVEAVGAVDAQVGCRMWGMAEVCRWCRRARRMFQAGVEPRDVGLDVGAVADTCFGEMAGAAGGYVAAGNGGEHGGVRHE
ncbi:hypothetical protein CYMTET_13941 [Cymbomonas tetramitiformis]|uniref:Uncharacterized protein n=1 Tax=Cymbomonas tetramitiformis TaxID=36881 RepID=A0AAE0LAD6_9CHLO|nr:hypothetical protein CYMTET_13941 [Cymbomonas tetramitiformis]